MVFPICEVLLVVRQNVFHVALFEEVDDFADLEVLKTSDDTADFDDPEEVFNISTESEQLERQQRNDIPFHIPLPILLRYFT